MMGSCCVVPDHMQMYTHTTHMCNYTCTYTHHTQMHKEKLKHTPTHICAVLATVLAILFPTSQDRKEILLLQMISDFTFIT